MTARRFRIARRHEAPRKHTVVVGLDARVAALVKTCVETVLKLPFFFGFLFFSNKLPTGLTDRTVWIVRRGRVEKEVANQGGND